MRYLEFGRTGLDVSAIRFGTWQAGGDWGVPHEKDLKGATRRALDLGINFFDTAQAYGFGASERLLGVLAPRVRARGGLRRRIPPPVTLTVTPSLRRSTIVGSMSNSP